MRRFAATAGSIVFMLAVASSADAQPLGTFKFQLQPYCNVVTLSVTQIGALYRLEGTDDQCGAATLAAASGHAFFNPSGTIGFGLTIVATPGGAPVTLDATISASTLSGTWRDSAGNNGAFVFTPGAGTGGAPRPVGGGVGAAAVNAAQVQLRVSGSCPPGSSIRTVNQDGTVLCQTGTGGDITSVVAGAGLTGGAAAGDATLAVAFAGSGAAATAARSDHTHALVQFRVEGQPNQPLPNGARTDLHWNNVVYNDGGGTYTAATGVYTVPVTGLYVVTATGATNNVAAPGAGTYRFITLHVNGGIVQQTADAASDTWQNLSLVAIRKLNAGDQIKLSIIHNLGAGITTNVTSGDFAHFSVTQLR